MDDETLLHELQRGDRTAFETVMQRHGPAVYKYAYALLDDRSRVEDMFQDTFLLLWRRRRNVAMGASSVLPWLLVSCRHIVFNQNRRDRRHRVVALEDAATVAEHSDASHELAWLSRELDELSPLDRRLVQLCLVEGRPYKEAATHLGLTPAAARKRIQRTRTRLAKGRAEARRTT